MPVKTILACESLLDEAGNSEAVSDEAQLTFAPDAVLGSPDQLIRIADDGTFAVAINPLGRELNTFHERDELIVIAEK